MSERTSYPMGMSMTGDSSVRDARYTPSISDFTPLLAPSVVDGAINLLALERAFVDFLSRWRDSIATLLPAVEVDTVFNGVEVAPFRSYLDSSVDLAEIHVFHVDDVNAQCAWIFDRRLVSFAVDCLFGGSAEVAPANIERRYTAVDLSIRHRLISFLVMAFEGAFPKQKSVRLRVARQERRIAHLHIAEPDELVVRVRFNIRLNRGECPIEFCAPLGVVRFLLAQGVRADPVMESDDSASFESTSLESPGDEGISGVGQWLPVELVAVLAETELTMAQLAALSIGQVLPLGNDHGPVRVFVDGSVVMTGRSGSRNGNYAVKIEKISVEGSHV